MHDIIFITGDRYVDHPMCGVAILKRLLEKNGYSVKVVELPKEDDIKSLEPPKLFFAVTSGSIDSMLKNYTALKKKRDVETPERAVILYCNWIKQYFKSSKIVIGGIEASLRRFVHYDYWDNKLRKPILFDSRADILVYGPGEKQILEIADGKEKVAGTCVISKSPEGKELPSYGEVLESKERFIDMQNMLSNNDLCQKIDNRYVVQYKAPEYTTSDLDEYYAFDFSRDVPKDLRGFQFSITTHRGCIGECNFCSLTLTQGNRIISRSKESILQEVKRIKNHAFFKGNIDDLGGPSANMYGMDCNKCNKHCIKCNNLDRSNKELIDLMQEISKLANVYVKSGVRFNLCSKEYLQELSKHVFDTIRIAPEHTDKDVLKLMNKDTEFKKDKMFSYYFMICHPGCDLEKARQLAKDVKGLQVSVQIFTPTPMTNSTCMYYTGMDLDKKPIYVPYSYIEKKEQMRLFL